MKRILLLLICITLFTSNYAEKYYWVGGTGKWSELQHWSPISGGISIHHGVIPTYNDTVYFDQNSFTASGQTVTIDVENAVCMLMDWTNAQFSPTLTNDGNNKLSIFSTLILCENMDFQFSGRIYFESEGDESIVTYGHNLSSDLYFNGTLAHYTFDKLNTSGNIFQDGLDCTLESLADVTCNKKINISSGVFKCENSTIKAGEIIASSSQEKTLFIDNSVIVLSSRWLLGTDYLILNNSNTVYFLTGKEAKFYAGKNNHYKSVKFEFDEGKAIYSGNQCSFDTLIAKASLQISGSNNQFGFTEIKGHAALKGSNTFDKLRLAPKKNYTLESDKTQTILTELIASGTCESFSHLKSSASAKATIFKANGAVTVNNVLIENVEAQGGASFTANSSDGLRSTTGWQINKNPRTLYWIGGNGEWGEPEHWSLTSGGTGGECIPFPTDNVIFDDNSFPNGNESVLVNTFKAYCNNMLWQTTSGTPEFTTLDKKMRIYGSLLLSEFMNFNYAGEFHFLSAKAGNTITTAGQQFTDTVYFNGQAGEWTLQDSLNCGYNHLYLTKGNVITQGNAIICGDFDSDNSNERTLDLDSSKVSIRGNWLCKSSENFDFRAGTSLITFSSENANVKAGNELQYHNLLFTDETGQGSIEGTECNFEKTVFQGNGNFKGENYYDTLEFSGGKVYKLDIEKPQHINTLAGEGSCSGYIVLRSKTVGQQAEIVKTTGKIQMNYMIVQDINASNVSGGFYAASSIDMGNNTAVTITSPPGENLYWVGNTGDWADSQNWSYASGGSGGACIPSPADHVFFDENSFNTSGQTVNVNVKEAFCKSMNWTGTTNSPNIINDGNSKLTIYGSLTLVENMNWRYYGDVIFENHEETHQITSAGNVLKNNVIFQGENGVWEFTDSFSVNQTIKLQNGTLKTNNHTLNANSFESLTDYPTALKPGNSNIKLAGNWEVNGNFSLGEGDFTFFFTGNPAYMTNNCKDSIGFNDVRFTNLSSNDIKINGTSTAGFKNIYFESVGEVSDLGVKYADTVSFGARGKIADKAFFTKVIFYDYGQVWDSIHADTVIMNAKGDVTGQNIVDYISAKGELLITGKNTLNYCKMMGDGGVYVDNTFGTLVFSPDKRYTFQGGRTQTILDEFIIRGNNCRHIYFTSSNNSKALVKKESGSVMGDFIEMQNIKGVGGADFYAGSFNHSDNIGNSCEGWKFENDPNYIYGLEQDTILIAGEQTTLSGEYMNGDSYTEYQWSNGETTENIEVNSPGKYSLTAVYGLVDGKICKYSDDIVVHFADLTSPFCSKDSTGSIKIETHNNDNYNFLWTNNETSNTLLNLPSGEYFVEVTDKITGNKTSRNIHLPDGIELDYQLTKKNPECQGDSNGSIKIVPQNGVAPFTAKWTNYGNIVNTELTALPSGEYYLEFSDAHCTKKDTIVLEEFPELSLEFKTSVSCESSNGGEILASVKGGLTDYSFEWENLPTEKDSILSALSGEKYYKLKLTDANGCQIRDSILFSQPQAFSATITSVENETCPNLNDGILKFEIFGGSPDYKLLLNNSEISALSRIENLHADSYELKISDKNNCLDTLEFEIEAAPVSSISIFATDAACGMQNGVIQYDISSTRHITSVEWTNSNNTIISSLNALYADWYFVDFTDEKNCSFRDSVQIMGSDCNSELEVPNIFTPNNDGMNDEFKMKAKNLLSFYCTVINRWGREVFSWNDYTIGWNGRLHGTGQQLSDGVYYYLIKALGEDGKTYNLKGHFYLEQ